MAQYNRSPGGWFALSDRKGNVLILGPQSAYGLRFIPLDPQRYTGVGVQVTTPVGLRKTLREFPPYGFRPLSKADVRQLQEVLNRFGAVPNALMMRLLGTEPVAMDRLNELRPRGVLSGPVAFTPSLNTIVKGQEELERKLEMKAYKLFKRKYPTRATFYGW